MFKKTEDNVLKARFDKWLNDKNNAINKIQTVESMIACENIITETNKFLKLKNIHYDTNSS